MPAPEPHSSTGHSTIKILPRHPHREIAELLATALLRLHAGRHESGMRDPREVILGFSGCQRVNTNPSDTEGVRN